MEKWSQKWLLRQNSGCWNFGKNMEILNFPVEDKPSHSTLARINPWVQVITKAWQFSWCHAHRRNREPGNLGCVKRKKGVKAFLFFFSTFVCSSPRIYRNLKMQARCKKFPRIYCDMESPVSMPDPDQRTCPIRIRDNFLLRCAKAVMSLGESHCPQAYSKTSFGQYDSPRVRYKFELIAPVGNV